MPAYLVKGDTLKRQSIVQEALTSLNEKAYQEIIKEHKKVGQLLYVLK